MLDYGRQTADQVLDELSFGVWVGRAPSGELLYANRAFRAIVGEDAGIPVDVEGAPMAYGIFDRQGQPYLARNLAFSRALARGEPAVVDDLVIHRRDGGRVCLRAFASPICDAAGVVTFTDITAEVGALVERADMEKHLSVAIHHAPVMLFTLDVDGVLTWRDGALKAVLERGRRAMVGQSMLALYEDHPTVPSNIRRALAETVSYSLEVGALALDVWLGPLRDDAGVVVGGIGVCTDVTEGRRLQSRIVQEDRIHAIGTLAAARGLRAEALRHPRGRAASHRRRNGASDLDLMRQWKRLGPAKMAGPGTGERRPA